MQPSYAHGVSNVPLLGQTIGDFLEESVAKFRTNEAMVSVFEDQRFTYAEFGAEVERVARALLGLISEKESASASGQPTARPGFSCNSRPRKSARFLSR